jgi:predicted nuclease of predicted toxin-antitoxin system
MKIKLDENIGRRGVELLTLAGHDVMTVRDQNLQGASDETLFNVCANEDRVLITLDHDFGQVLRFPPERAPVWSSWNLARG